MAVDFTGWVADDEILFGWPREVVSIKQAAVVGHNFTVLATNIEAKADGEMQGIRITEAGGFPAYQRRFFFAVFYKNAGVSRDVRTYLKTGYTLVDNDGVEWHIESVANPGGADEHLEVLGFRAPVE